MYIYILSLPDLCNARVIIEEVFLTEKLPLY